MADSRELGELAMAKEQKVTDVNTWPEHRNLVLEGLQRLEEKIDCIDHKVGDLRIAVAVLKVKSGIWGAVAGALTVGLPLLIVYLVRSLSK